MIWNFTLESRVSSRTAEVIMYPQPPKVILYRYNAIFSSASALIIWAAWKSVGLGLWSIQA